MTYNISINQKKFPFIKKRIEVYQNNNAIYISEKSLFKSHGTTIPIDYIDEHPQIERETSIGYLLTATILTGYFLWWLASWLWNPPANSEDIAFYIFCQSFLFLGIIDIWRRWGKNRFNTTVYFTKYTNEFAFSFDTNSPDKPTYSKFVEQLNDIIREAHRHNHRETKSLSSIPTNLLYDELNTRDKCERLNAELEGLI